MTKTYIVKSTRIPFKTWLKLRQHAFKKGISQNAIVRNALQKYLKNPTFPEDTIEPLNSVLRIFHLPKNLAIKIEQTAKQHEVSTAYIMRTALNQYFKAIEGEQHD